MKTTYYIIRHKPSGEIMPAARSGAGYSHWNPTNKEEFTAADNVPRLFETKERAFSVCRSWCKGKRTRSYDIDDLGHAFYSGTIIIPVSERKMSDLEVMEVSVFLEHQVKYQYSNAYSEKRALKNEQKRMEKSNV